MKLEVENFNGVAPKIHPRRLAEDMAQTAQNVRFDRLRLEPFKAGEVQAQTFTAGTEEVFLYENQYWLEAARPTDFVEAPLAVDPNRYLIIVDGVNAPQITRNDVALTTAPYPAVTYDLNVPSPISAPSLQPVAKANPDPDADDLDEEDVVYVYTYIDTWGRESQPSPLSNPLTYNPLTQDIEVTTTGIPTTPNDHPLLNSSASIRIYRTNTGTGGGVFQFVAETAITDTVFTDDIKSENLGEELPSVGWDPAPDLDTNLNPRGPLHTLVGISEGFLCGLTENEVCFSEQGVLHAFPVAYRKSIRKYKLVGAVVTAEGIFIGTNGEPYFAYGNTPASMTVAPIDSTQACVSKQSMVNVDGVVFYASPDGLCAFAGGQVTNMTAELFSQDEWETLTPENIHGYAYEGMYIGFYNGGGFIFNPRGGKNAWSWLSIEATCGFSDISTDSLYLLKTNNDFVVFNENNSSDLTYEWKSKLFRLPSAFNFGVGQVVADTYPVALEVKSYDVYGNVQTQTFSVENQRPFYMASGFLSEEWEFKVTGSNIVHKIALGSTFEEFT